MNNLITALIFAGMLYVSVNSYLTMKRHQDKIKELDQILSVLRLNKFK
ncbi:hypothetical protein NUITMVRA1_13350 [Aerococcus viridans]|nr:hypothetical protein NUITMVRA1_13350 [Aerococcus viridans]